MVHFCNLPYSLICLYGGNHIKSLKNTIEPIFEYFACGLRMHT